MRSWLQDVREHADPHLTCILVGNKIDLCSDDPNAAPPKRKREVTTEEGELWAKEEGLLFVEASAKSGENVEAAFERATRDILEKVHRGVFDDDRVRVSQGCCCQRPPCACLSRLPDGTQFCSRSGNVRQCRTTVPSLHKFERRRSFTTQTLRDVGSLPGGLGQAQHDSNCR